MADKGGCFESIKKKLFVVWPFFGPKKTTTTKILSFLRVVFWNFVDEREPQKNTIKNVFVEFIIILFSSSSRFKNRKKKKIAL